MRDLHKEWEDATVAERTAANNFHDAQRVMWNAEYAWDRARERAQRAYVALANASAPADHQ